MENFREPMLAQTMLWEQASEFKPRDAEGLIGALSLAESFTRFFQCFCVKSSGQYSAGSRRCAVQFLAIVLTFEIWGHQRAAFSC